MLGNGCLVSGYNDHGVREHYNIFLSDHSSFQLDMSRMISRLLAATKKGQTGGAAEEVQTSNSSTGTATLDRFVGTQTPAMHPAKPFSRLQHVPPPPAWSSGTLP